MLLNVECRYNQTTMQSSEGAFTKATLKTWCFEGNGAGVQAAPRAEGERNGTMLEVTPGRLSLRGQAIVWRNSNQSNVRRLDLQQVP